MHLGNLILPIAAATALNAFLFALAWRGHQIERDTGREPRWLYPAIVLYAAPLLLSLYVVGMTPPMTYPAIFLAAMTGEAMGGLVVYAILNALFFTRGQGAEHRAGPIFAAIFLVGLLVAAAFQ